MLWSGEVNGFFYKFVAIVLQIAEAHNVTVPGGRAYNVPTGNITFDTPGGDAASQSLISYSEFAISGADDFTDGDTTVEEVFDTVVKTTREVTPTCEFVCRFVVFAYCVDLSLVKLELSGLLGTRESVHHLRESTDDILF